MRVYISGAISKDPDHAEKFAAAFVALEKMGHDPVNPVCIGLNLKNKLGREPTRYEYMRHDIKAMMACDGICMLPGWTKSWGAIIEQYLASKIGIKRIEL